MDKCTPARTRVYACALHWWGRAERGHANPQRHVADATHAHFAANARTTCARSFRAAPMANAYHDASGSFQDLHAPLRCSSVRSVVECGKQHKWTWWCLLPAWQWCPVSP